MLYSPRSGSTSIMKYFGKVRPEFVIINQPWSKWGKTKILSLEELSIHENLFVKNEISWLDPAIKYKHPKLPTIPNVISFFDKIIILSRKNIDEQALSLYFAEENDSHDSTDFQIYNTSLLKKDKYELHKDKLLKTNNFISEYFENKFTHYYYEDLYFGTFTNLFKELEISFDEECFNQILNISMKYKVGEINKNKETKSII